MEDMVASTPSKVLSMHKNSHLISKLIKPKIRIVHIFAPEIIKTDASNFRELVQRLTGKPTTAESKGRRKKTKKLPCRTLVHDHANKTVQLEDVNEEKIKEEDNDHQMMWGKGSSTSSSGNFFDGFKDFDTFIQELSESSHDMEMDVLDQV